MSEFDVAWRKAKNNIFRLETLLEYKVSGDWENFQKFLKGKKENLESKDEYKGWLADLKAKRQKGIKIQRVRIFQQPLSEYQKYEIYYWQRWFASGQGEDILFLAEINYKKLIAKIKFKPKDFWMFDDKVIIVLEYGLKGEFLGESQTISNVAKYKKIKYALLDKAMPMEKFVSQQF